VARSSSWADLALVEVRHGVVHVALRAELHDANDFTALGDDIGLDGPRSAVVPRKIL